MKKSAIAYLSILLTSGVPAIAVAQGFPSENERLTASLESISRLEYELGNNNPRLTEPLTQLAIQYRNVGRFADAHRAIDRATQIVRINEGLYTPTQLPLVQMKVANFADSNDWNKAREQLEHLLWLHRSKSGYIDDQLVNDLMRLNELHLRGISEDTSEYQTFHFRRAATANWLALRAGEQLWGGTDPRLIPVLYALIKYYHLQALAVENGGRTGYELRQIVPGTDWVREREDMRRYLHLTGLRLLDQIRSIYLAARSIDLEGAAMTNLYTADWHMLFREQELALNAYQRSHQELLYAGLTRDTLGKYFAQPSLLPEPEFHATLVEASLARNAVAPVDSESELPDDSARLFFAEWSSSFPFARSPYSVATEFNADANTALFTFNVSGLTEITRWVSRRRERGFAELVDVDLLRPNPVSLDAREELIERLEWLAFRPRLVNGMPVEASATLVYRSAGSIP